MDICALNQLEQEAVLGVHCRQPATGSANNVLPAALAKHNRHRLPAMHILMYDPQQMETR